MQDTLIDTATQIINSANQFIQQLAIADPIARQTSWRPLIKGGANFGTHRLVKKGQNKIRFDLSRQGLIFVAICLFTGAFLFYGGTNFVLDGEETIYTFGNAFMIFFSILIFWLIGWMIRPITFDKQVGFFWKGSKTPSQNISKNSNIKDWAFLYGIHALQIIAEDCEARDSKTDEVTTYKSYELNLILKDATRVNVVDHGDYFALEEDAQKLSQFLNVPIWDAVKPQDQSEGLQWI